MNPIKKLGVFLNEEPGDREAIAFTNLLAKIDPPESIHCIMVRGIEDSVETPPPDPEVIRDQIREQISSKVSIQVCEGNGLYEMLRTARDQDLDMIVVGRRLPSDQLGVGQIFYRLARKSPCNVLVVPEHAYAHLSRLVVLSDGCPHSKLALEAALYLSKASRERPQVVVQSVYSVAYGYRYSALSPEEAAQKLETQQRKKMKEFLAEVDTSGVDFEVVFKCSRDTAGAAHDLASAKNMDAIVVGSRGATLPAIALIGSTTEQVLLNSPVPVLVVKKKGETFGFLDALLAQIGEPE